MQPKMKFKLFSTEIIVSYTLVCLVAFAIILNFSLSFLCCLFSIIIHESGHIFAMYVLGNPPNLIRLSPFEITISDSKRCERKLYKNIIIIILGPFCNFVCFIVFYLLYLMCNGMFLSLAIANLSVGLFNILPVMSLDGGQLLYLLLCKRFSDAKSEKIVNIITFIFIFPIAVLGFIMLFESAYNFSLLFVCVYLIFSLIFKNNRYY